MYRQIPPRILPDIWPYVAPWVAQAIGETEEDWEDLDYIRNRISMGSMQLWTGHHPQTNVLDLVLITEGMMIGATATLVLRWMSGTNLEDKLFDIGVLERWAIVNGFKKVQVWGRPGFEKLLKPLHYRRSFIVLERDLEQGVH